MRMLGVDDDAVWRTMVVKGLAKSRYDTVEARDGREALAMLQSRGAISLLITDMMMPEFEGLGLLEHTRRTPSLANLPVLICSELGSSDVLFRAAHRNVLAHLLKPIDLPRLR